MIQVEHLQKTYHMGTQEVKALRGVTLSIVEGEFVAIMGPSGSGKSTFMNILGCLDKPTGGTYILDGEHVDGLTDDELSNVRNQKIGFVFQSYNLIPRKNTLEQVVLPLKYNPNIPHHEHYEIAKEALKKVSLLDRLDHKPTEMSGGQQQRVAIARSLVCDPKIIFGDEPTGNLDTRTSEEILAIFQELNDEGKTIVMVTHEEDVAHHAKRIIRFKDGHLVFDEPVTERVNALDVLKTLPLFDEDDEEEIVG